MKPLFTLLITTLLSLSLMGQQSVSELQKQRFEKKHNHSLRSLESKVFKKPDRASRHFSGPFSILPGNTLKADQATDMTMDSILWELFDTNTSVWTLSERELFVYDANGNMTGYVWFAYDSSEMKIIPVDQETVTYNPQGQPTEIIWLEWDKTSGQWVKYAKFELTYDGEGNLVQETVYEWDSVSSQWLVGIRYDMTYDGTGNLVEEIWFYWDEDSAKLVPTYRDEYLYEGGKLTTWNEYYREEGGWELTFYTTYTYDQDNLIEEMTKGWDYLLEDWGDYAKTIYTYAGGRVATEEVWDFDWFQFMMVRQNLYEYTWDADGNMTTEIESDWVEGAAKSWSEATEWVNTWKSEWTFNKDVSIFNLYVPYWFQMDDTEINFVHMPLTETGYFNNNGTWDLNYRQTAYYSEFGGGGPSGVADVNEAPVRVYPIPASDVLTFSWDEKYPRLELEIYDLTGKQIMYRSIENNKTIRVDELARGLYLYKLSIDKHLVNVGKFNLR